MPLCAIFKVDFEFVHVDSLSVCKSIKSLKNKAPGYDKITAKILKVSSPIIAPLLTDIFNSCVDHSVFPAEAKLGEITPGYKRGEHTSKGNYRPLSVLTVVSKVLEDLMLLQITPFNNDVLHPLISAYRDGYGCQDVSLKFVTDITTAIDQDYHVAAVTTDLSAAFDCLPPTLMYHKLRAYGFHQNSAKFLYSYLTGRKQRVKLGTFHSKWLDLEKGTPQGSKLGPCLWNWFVNDFIYYLPPNSAVNFADDNTMYAVSKTLQGLVETLTKNVNMTQLWYHENGMKSNPDKFQAISFGETPNCDILQTL